MTDNFLMSPQNMQKDLMYFKDDLLKNIKMIDNKRDRVILFRMPFRTFGSNLGEESNKILRKTT